MSDGTFKNTDQFFLFFHSFFKILGTFLKRNSLFAKCLNAVTNFTKSPHANRRYSDMFNQKPNVLVFKNISNPTIFFNQRLKSYVQLKYSAPASSILLKLLRQILRKHIFREMFMWSTYEKYWDKKLLMSKLTYDFKIKM